MAFFPHTLLEDCVSFFVQPSEPGTRSISWSYDGGKEFVVEADRGGLQRLFFILIEKHLDLDPRVELVIGPSMHENTPFQPALAIGFKPGILRKLEIALDSDPGIRRLMSESRFIVFGNEVLFPIESIAEDIAAPPIDTVGLEKKLGRHEDSTVLLELFFESTSQKLLELETCLANSEFGSAHRLAHSIKGGALTICADSLAVSAKNLESSLKTDPDAETAVNLYNRVLGTYREAEQYYNKWKRKQQR